jgi:hypothetical protein
MQYLKRRRGRRRILVCVDFWKPKELLQREREFMRFRFFVFHQQKRNYIKYIFKNAREQQKLTEQCVRVCVRTQIEIVRSGEDSISPRTRVRIS